MNQSAADYDSAVEKGYRPGFESWFGKPIVSHGFYDHAGAPYGYIASSSNDLAKLLTFMLEGGDLLSEENLGLIKTPPKDGKTYGFGWHFSKTEHFPFHGGATPDYRAQMFFIPEQDMAAVLLTNKYNIMEDSQVSHIMNRIRSILNGTEPGELPVQNNSIKWSILGVTIFLAILTVVHFFSLSFAIGIISVLLAVGLLPLFVFVMGAPWNSVNLFAPDIAFLIKCLIAIFAVNGVMALCFSL